MKTSLTKSLTNDKQLVNRIVQDIFNRVPDNFSGSDSIVSSIKVTLTTAKTDRGPLRQAHGSATVRMTVNAYIDTDMLAPTI